MKLTKQTLTAIAGIGALSLLCFAGNAKAGVKQYLTDVKQYFSNGNLNQYFELQTGANFGKNTFTASMQIDMDTIDSMQIDMGTIDSNTENLNFGYGVNFQRKEDPTRAASFANGFSIGVNAGITAGGKLGSGKYTLDDDDNSDGSDSSHSEIAVIAGDKISYNLMLTAGFDVMKYKNYKISLVGGAGLALNNSYVKVRSSFVYLETNKVLYDKTSKYHKTRTSFIAKAGVKQEFFVTKNISLGLEADYSYLGKYSTTIDDFSITADNSVAEMPHFDIKTNLGGQFTTNFSIKYYL